MEKKEAKNEKEKGWIDFIVSFFLFFFPFLSFFLFFYLFPSFCFPSPRPPLLPFLLDISTGFRVFPSIYLFRSIVLRISDYICIVLSFVCFFFAIELSFLRKRKRERGINFLSFSLSLVTFIRYCPSTLASKKKRKSKASTKYLLIKSLTGEKKYSYVCKRYVKMRTCDMFI